MGIKTKISNIRELPESLSARKELIRAVCVIFLGLALGVVAKATDSYAEFANVSDYLGIWAFIATLVAVFNRTPLLAALNTVLFFLALLGGYFTYEKQVLGFFSVSYFYGWLAISLLSSLAGAVVWFARGKGWPAVICASLPVALLMTEGYPAFYTYKPAFILDLIFAGALLVILPKRWKQKGGVLTLALVLAFVLVECDIIMRFFPW